MTLLSKNSCFVKTSGSFFPILWPSHNVLTLYFRSTNFTWNKPIPPTETTGEEDEEVDDSELNLDKVEEEMAADYSDEEEEEILHIDDLQAAMPGI